MSFLPEIPLTREEAVQLIVLPGLWAVVVLTIAWRPWQRRGRVDGTWTWAAVIALGGAVLAKYFIGQPRLMAMTSGKQWLYWVAVGVIAIALIDSALRLPAWQRLFGAAAVAVSSCLLVSWGLLHRVPLPLWTGSEALLYVGAPAAAILLHAWSIDRYSRWQSGWVTPFLYMATLAATAIMTGTSGTKSLTDVTIGLTSLLGGAWLVGIFAPRLSLARGGSIALATLWILLMACVLWFGQKPRVLDLGLLAVAPLAAWLAELTPGVRHHQRVAALVGVFLTLAALAYPVCNAIVELQRMLVEDPMY